MRYRIIACRVFEKELAGLLGRNHGHELLFLEFGYHRRPRALQERLQELSARPGDMDAILFLYGYCGGTMNLRAGNVPIVIPRCHDCFDIMLGPAQRRALFDEEPGTYFLSEGWLRHDRTPSERILELARKYSRDGRPETGEMINRLYAGYRRTVLVRTGAETDESRLRARRICQDLPWKYEERDGGLVHMNKMISGAWDDDFVVRDGRV